MVITLPPVPVIKEDDVMSACMCIGNSDNEDAFSLETRRVGEVMARCGFASFFSPLALCPTPNGE